MKKAKPEQMDGGGGEDDAVVVGQMSTVMVPRHINKRALKNKALSVSFDEKNLRDYVTGFHKRKKKRRKEAQKQIEEKDRKKRITDRKKRKQEREIALYGKLLSDDTEQNEGGQNGGEETEFTEPIKETRTYEDNSTRVVVTTSEISKEDDLGTKHINPNPNPNPKPVSGEKNPSLALKTKPMKKISKPRQHKKKKGSSSNKVKKKRDKKVRGKKK